MGRLLTISGLTKRFTLHLQDGLRLPVFDELDLTLESGQALALTGPSGIGKSSLMRLIYGTYKADSGRIEIDDGERVTDMVAASPRDILGLRRSTLGYVSQFLRVIPRVPTLDVVAEPLVERGEEIDDARKRAADLLARLRIPQRLWSLSPVTFSGGEQQRVNIARSFAAPFPLLLLDEPTASLDAENRQTVLDMIVEARDQGTAMIAIFHSADDRDAVCTGTFDLAQFAGARS